VERQRYQELFEEADGYLVTDPQGTIQSANCAAATLLNVSQKFLVGQPYITFVPESERLDVQSHLIQPLGNWVRGGAPATSGRSKLIDVAVVVATVRNKASRSLCAGCCAILPTLSGRRKNANNFSPVSRRLALRQKQPTA